MEKALALDPIPLYESCMVAFYRGAPAPGAPMVPMPLVHNLAGNILEFGNINYFSASASYLSVAR